MTAVAIRELTPTSRAPCERVREGRVPERRGRRGAPRHAVERAVRCCSTRPRELRDRGRGRRITFSAKVFVPLTTLCRDYCGYCTFRKDPGRARRLHDDARGGPGPRQGRRAARRQGSAVLPRRQARGRRSPSIATFLRRMGHRTTLDYLRAVERARPAGDRTPAPRQSRPHGRARSGRSCAR